MDNGWGDCLIVWLESAFQRHHGADEVDWQVNPIQSSSQLQVNPNSILGF